MSFWGWFEIFAVSVAAFFRTVMRQYSWNWNGNGIENEPVKLQKMKQNNNAILQEKVELYVLGLLHGFGWFVGTNEHSFAAKETFITWATFPVTRRQWDIAHKQTSVTTKWYMHNLQTLKLNLYQKRWQHAWASAKAETAAELRWQYCRSCFCNKGALRQHYNR